MALGLALVRVKVPFMVRLFAAVTPVVLLMVRLLKTDVPVIVCAVEPEKETVPVPAVKVPLFDQLAFTSKV